MYFAFVVHPRNRPGMSMMFLSEKHEYLAGFEIEDLKDMVHNSYGEAFSLEDMLFFELGEYRPLSFEKRVSYTLMQE